MTVLVKEKCNVWFKEELTKWKRNAEEIQWLNVREL